MSISPDEISQCNHRERIISFSFLFSADTISSVQFNESGEFLAAGDKGGRIVVFKRDIEVNRFENAVQFNRLSPLDTLDKPRLCASCCNHRVEYV